MEEGHPLQAPCKDTLTIPLLYDSNCIAPPSCSTAGLIYSSNTSIIFLSTSPFGVLLSSVIFLLRIVFSSSIYFFIKSLNSILISSQLTFSFFVNQRDLN